VSTLQATAKINVERQARDLVGGKIRACQNWLGMVGHARSSGCLYREKGLNERDDCMTEHPIPIADLARLHLEQQIPLHELIFFPVARIRKASDVKLSRRAVVKTGATLIKPFSRYAEAGIEILAFDGELIPGATWTMDDHWRKMESCAVLQAVRREVLNRIEHN